MQIDSYEMGFDKFRENFGIKQHVDYRYNEKEINEGYYHPVNLHYSGYVKPWQKKPLKLKECWWYYANKTKYMDEIMKFYNFKKSKVNEILSKINITNNTPNFVFE